CAAKGRLAVADFGIDNNMAPQHSSHVRLSRKRDRYPRSNSFFLPSPPGGNKSSARRRHPLNKHPSLTFLALIVELPLAFGTLRARWIGRRRSPCKRTAGHALLRLGERLRWNPCPGRTRVRGDGGRPEAAAGNRTQARSGHRTRHGGIARDLSRNHALRMGGC